MRYYYFDITIKKGDEIKVIQYKHEKAWGNSLKHAYQSIEEIIEFEYSGWHKIGCYLHS